MYHDTDDEDTCVLDDILRYPKCILRQYLVAHISDSAQPLIGNNVFLSKTAETD